MTHRVTFTIRVGGAAPNPWDFQPSASDHSEAFTIRSHYLSNEKNAERAAQQAYPIDFDAENGVYSGPVEQHFIEKARKMVEMKSFAGPNFYQTDRGRIEWKFAGGSDRVGIHDPIYHCDYNYTLTLFNVVELH